MHPRANALRLVPTVVVLCSDCTELAWVYNHSLGAHDVIALLPWRRGDFARQTKRFASPANTLIPSGLPVLLGIYRCLAWLSFGQESVSARSFFC